MDVVIPCSEEMRVFRARGRCTCLVWSCVQVVFVSIEAVMSAHANEPFPPHSQELVLHATVGGYVCCSLCVLFTLSPLWFYCWHFMIVCGVLLTWFVAHLSSWVFWGLGGEIFSNCSLRKGSCRTSPPSTKYLTILIRRQISYRSRHNSATYKTRAISFLANFIFRLVWWCVSFVSFHFESWPQPSLDTQT